MLRWSKTAPLTIALRLREGDPHRVTALAPTIAANLHRLQSLEVSGIGVNTRNADFISLLTFPAPRLEKLVLMFYDPGSDADLPVFDLPGQLLQGCPGRLKHLEIMDFGIPGFGMLPLVPTLTHLQLGSEFSMPTRPSLPVLLKTLRQLPQLETLVLSNYVPAADAHPSGIFDGIVDCPSLLKVKLKDLTLSMQSLLNHIQIPGASVELLSTNPPDSLDILRQLLAALTKARNISTPLPLEELSVSETDAFPQRLLLSLAFNTQLNESDFDRPSIRIGFPRPIRQNLMQLIPVLGERCMDMQSLHSLHMKSRRWKFTRREWIVLGQLPYLKSITFSCDAEAIDFCAALNDDAGSTTRITSPLFRSLYSLSFEGVALIYGSYVRHSLVTALDRRPHDSRVAELNVTSPDEGFTESDVKFLREAVPGLEVVWVKGDDGALREGEQGEEGSDGGESIFDEEDSVGWD